ncbi:MAG: VCBS repeat-containing protein [Acidobacteria bacterium]|nr:VCBS repeat-containing protein [Acidobacteriota bacterium]
MNPRVGFLGDVNGDGRADLIVSTQIQGAGFRIAALLNTGNGSFQPALMTESTQTVTGAAFADLNNDGKLDLIAAFCCGNVSNIVYRLSNGNGTFQSEVPWQPWSSLAMIYRDVNEDGKPDLISISPGTASFLHVAPNTAGAAPLCTFDVSYRVLLSSGAENQFAGRLTAPGSSCSWTAQSSVPWLSITPQSGSGSTDYTITVQSNTTGGQRVGSVTIGRQAITVTQAVAVPCGYAINTSSLSVGAAGANIDVSINASCSWSITSLPAWITVQSPVSKSGSGNGVIQLNIAANPGPARRAVVAIGPVPLPVLQTGTTPIGSTRFVPLAPCRLMETRAAYNFEGRTGAFGPPGLTASERRTLPIPQSSVCNVPASAKAYVLNVTVIPTAGGVGFVKLFPAGSPYPAFHSVSSPDGQIVANSNIVAGGINGSIEVSTSDAADLLIDIAGYYTDEAPTGLLYYPLTPCRVIDTRALYRPQPGTFGPPSMAARETRKFRFPATPYCTIPQAAAYSFTITAVPPSPLAYLTAWPDGSSQPNVSSINSFAGRVLANSVIIPAGSDGTIDFFAYDATDFIVDINGYFAPDNGTTGLHYFPVQQCIAGETSGRGNESTWTINIPSSGCPGIPSNAQAYALNVTAFPAGYPMPFLTAYPTGQPQPNTSILNAFQGQTVTNSAIIPAGTGGAVNIYVYRHTAVTVGVSGYFGR